MFESFARDVDINRAHFSRVLRPALDYVGMPVPVRQTLRVSSLPYCAIQHYLKAVSGATEVPSFRMSFYTEIGTAVHELLQTIIPISKHGLEVFGRWKCGCKDKHGNPVIKGPCIKRIRKCKKCKKQYTYEEVELEYRGLSGHIDMITRDDEGKYYLWEFKTTKDARAKYLPSDKHRVQAETYSYLMKKLFNIDIEAYAIIYFERGQFNTGSKKFYEIFPTKITKEILQQRKKEVSRAIRTHKVVKLALLGDPDAIDKIIEDRPCACKEDYDRYMKSSFYMDNPSLCPYANNGYCFAKKDTALHRLIEKWGSAVPEL